MRTHSIRIMLLLGLACASPAWGELVLPHYDLDTLYTLSDDIVLAKVDDAQPARRERNAVDDSTVTVLSTFKGTITPGRQIRVANLSVYRRCRDLNQDDETYEPLRKGDTVYLFFESAGAESRHWPRPATTGPDTPRHLVSLGIRLLDGGRVYGFAQYFPRFDTPPERWPAGRPKYITGSLGLVTMTTATYPDVVIETRVAFEQRLKSSPDRVAKIQTLLDAPAGNETKAQVLAALRERFAAEKIDQALDDNLGAKLGYRYGPLATPAELASLVGEAFTSDTRRSLQRGFRTPEGRAFLIERLSDPQASEESREGWASVVGETAWDYQREAREGATNDIHFVEKLARVAVAQQGTRLFPRLLEALTSVADPTDRRAGPLSADRDAAAAVLANAFADARAVDQYAIAASLMQISPTQYAKVLPNAGPMLTLVEPNHDRYPPVPPRTLRLNCRFCNRLKVSSELKLVLQPKHGGPELVAAIDRPAGDRYIGDLTDNFGYEWRIQAPLPADAAGAYFAFLRIFVNGRPVGDGLGCDVTIPKP